MVFFFFCKFQENRAGREYEGSRCDTATIGKCKIEFGDSSWFASGAQDRYGESKKLKKCISLTGHQQQT
jgi:hypothetical protein